MDPKASAFIVDYGHILNEVLLFTSHGEERKYAFADGMEILLATTDHEHMMNGIYPDFKKDSRVAITKTTASMPDGWYGLMVEPKCTSAHTMTVFVKDGQATIFSLYAEGDMRVHRNVMPVPDLIKYAIGCLKDNSEKCKNCFEKLTGVAPEVIEHEYPAQIDMYKLNDAREITLDIIESEINKVDFDEADEDDVDGILDMEMHKMLLLSELANYRADKMIK